MSTRVRFGAPPPSATPFDRLAATCDMHDVAIAQLVARLRRTRPEITAAELERAVVDWLQGGDPGWGRPVKLPR